MLAKPIGDATGWPLSWIVGGLSLGLLVSGLVSPMVGRLVARYGGRPVLSASAILLSAGLLVLSVAPSITFYFLAWVILGLGMGAGFYDPAFSALGRLYGEQAREAITRVTLFGGFASTVCWPLSELMVEHIGWRGVCAAYAAINLLVTLPLYRFGLPREHPHQAPAGLGRAGPVPPAVPRSDDRAMFVLLAASLTLASAIMTLISIHLLTILRDGGMAMTTAVSLGALVGPSQVGARVLEIFFGRKSHPIWTLLAATILVAIGLGLMIGASGAAAVGIVLYGAGSGIRSIARGTVPLALFGRDGYAVLMGRLALPSLVAQAASPFLGAILLDSFHATATVALLCCAAVVNIGLVLLLLPGALRRPA